MALTKNALSKNFRAGKTFWRCLPSTKYGVDIQEVLLLGKKVIRDYGSIKIMGAERLHTSRWSSHTVTRGDYYMGDLAGYNVAHCFDTRRKALKFKADFEAGRLPEVKRATIDHEEECASMSYEY